MILFDRPSARQVDVALAILRVTAGVIFFMHGYQKVFQFGLSGIAGGFAQMGIPLAGFTGPAIGILELVGGLALIVGLFTRLFGLLFVCDMLGAILFVHGKVGFFLPNGFEFALALCAVGITLAIAGGGSFSADGAFARRRVVAT